MPSKPIEVDRDLDCTWSVVQQLQPPAATVANWSATAAASLGIAQRCVVRQLQSWQALTSPVMPTTRSRPLFQKTVGTRPGEIVVKFADGKPHRAPQRTVSFAYAFDGFSTNDDFLVTELNYAFDCFLGMPWLACYMPEIDWLARSVRRRVGYDDISNPPSRAREGMKKNTVEQRLPYVKDAVEQRLPYVQNAVEQGSRM
ncbi:hypothetical protein PR003_g11002 [Phytophthora rubi]|uniref:Uncharacterized protein n=3 Tax=Phytophthora TaxID=4783 RepID=A0A6A4FPJ2_9STRA|nr:hypothetical protein PR003_g11002 [Phytophthora rubi]